MFIFVVKLYFFKMGIDSLLKLIVSTFFRTRGCPWRKDTAGLHRGSTYRYGLLYGQFVNARRGERMHSELKFNP